MDTFRFVTLESLALYRNLRVFYAPRARNPMDTPRFVAIYHRDLGFLS